MTRIRGQTLVSVALLLPVVLLPLMAYAVQATLLATRAGLLQAAVGRAAEDATAGVDVAILRAGGGLVLDPAVAGSIARDSLLAMDPGAVVDSIAVGSTTVTVTAHERVNAGFGEILGAGATVLRATATAQVTAGYASPSSRLPLPKRSLSMIA
ncbi:MAG TPA: hypothetical protein VNG93_09710 [Candidatus Dormibacteraeota bacterium]|nr:hypothetical protein [Candidatus Dormibacteraeota bacterium]